MDDTSDVIVIGGGPGGASCAAALARDGLRVLLLDMADFPRDHVGEALSPSVLAAVERLGAGREVRDAGFARKAGATFVWGDVPWAWTVGYQPHSGPVAYHVRRAEFDAILLRAAAAADADVRLGWRVVDVEHSPGHPAVVLAESPDGNLVSLTAPWVVDASGAQGLLSRRQGRINGPPELNRMAMWGRWRRDRHLGEPTGNSLLIGRRGTCWWYYPLDDRSSIVSVGVVLRDDGTGRPPAESYRSAVSSCPELAWLLTGAVLDGAVTTMEAHASASPRLAGSGWFLVGDAAFFVDSLLTPGVQLAMQSGLLAAQCLQTILTRPAEESAILELYERTLRRDYETFTRLCGNLYRAAETAPRPGAASQPAAAPEGAGQLAFLSLISGLSKAELAAAMGTYMARRAQGAARAGRPVVPGEKEGFAFLAWLFHQDELAVMRADHDSPEPDEYCLLRPAPGAGIGEELFAPSADAHVLISRKAARNRFGDRFEATPELVTLFEVIGDGCPYEKAIWRLCSIAGCQHGDCRPELADWIKLLADHGLIEWGPAGQEVT